MENKIIFIDEEESEAIVMTAKFMEEASLFPHITGISINHLRDRLTVRIKTTDGKNYNEERSIYTEWKEGKLIRKSFEYEF